ncbi:MAG: flagellar biosynthetic protein FliO [Lachnospiraceae bacterium]|nr:flagellar biosynthetic protein FliO [Lachnospiraceae bacterium]
MLAAVNPGNSSPSVISIFTLLLVFALVLVMAYFAARFVAKYQGNALNNKSNIRVVESFRIDGNKVIAIIKIGEGYYAVALAKETVTLIDKLNPDELNNLKADSTLESNKFDFKDILSQVKNKNSKDNSDTK